MNVGFLIGTVKCFGAEVAIQPQDLSNVSASQPSMFPWISRPVGPPRGMAVSAAASSLMSSPTEWSDDVWSDLASLLHVYRFVNEA